MAGRLPQLEDLVGDRLVHLRVAQERGAAARGKAADPLERLEHVGEAKPIVPHSGTASTRTRGRIHQ